MTPKNSDDTQAKLVTHTGGCHCGAVRFEVQAAAEAVVTECNCSMCGRFGYLHLIVPKGQFELVSDEESITTYTFNTGVAQHYFCKVCGIKSFYVPRSHPDGISVNARCLDEGTFRILDIRPFDGQQWEKTASELPPTAS